LEGGQMEREAPSPGDRRMARLPCDGECAGSGPSGWSVTWWEMRESGRAPAGLMPIQKTSLPDCTSFNQANEKIPEHIQLIGQFS